MGRAELSKDMVAALVCREYAWTFEEFQAQPSWFIDIILSMLQTEAEQSNRKKDR